MVLDKGFVCSVSIWILIFLVLTESWDVKSELTFCKKTKKQNWDVTVVAWHHYCGGRNQSKQNIRALAVNSFSNWVFY